MFKVFRNWILRRIEKHGQDAGARPPASFDNKNVIADGGELIVGDNWFLQLLNANAFFLSPPPNAFCVLIYPDGSTHEMPGGVHVIPPGLYRLKYVSRMEHFLITPMVDEMTQDGEKLSLSVLVRYQVKNPVIVLQVENPISALTEYIQIDIAQYIRTHDHSHIMDSSDKHEQTKMFSFFDERHGNRHPLSDAILITGVELKEFTGDKEYVELRRNQLSQRQEQVDRQRLEHQKDFDRITAEYKATIDILKAKIDMMQASHVAELNKIAMEKALEQSNENSHSNPKTENLTDNLLALLNKDNSDHVSFTAYYPKEGSIEFWHTLLVYVHLLPALAQVRKDFERFADKIKSPKESTSKSSMPIVQGSELTIIPSCEGVTFNPERVSLKWMEDFHRTDFRFKANQSLSGDAAKGSIDIYVGPLIIGSIKFAMLFNDKDIQPTLDHEEKASMYGKDDVFISYSRKDTEVARTFKTVLEGSGFDVFLDVDDIRSGQLWEEELKRRIERAKIFQIFWSPNYSQSENCKQEWEYALRQNKEEGFIRPVFWEKPLSPKPPEELNKFNFKYVELGNIKD